MKSVVRALVIAALILLLSNQPARAIILYSSATRNTSAPTGSLANSGWQYEGDFKGFLGTAISKKFFITAGHFGGGIGDNFVIDGQNHRVVQVWGDPHSDLRIYQTVGSFNNPAPLFKDSTETGRGAIMFGRGTTRGSAVVVNGVTKGWEWDSSLYDGTESWGRNGISSVVGGGPGGSQLLKMTFDANGGSYEGALSYGDSGGGVFVSQGGHWKLAGINYSVDGQFSTSSFGGNPFDAAIFDRTGLWEEGVGFTAASSTPIATASYATRISTRMSWINGVLGGTIAPGIPTITGGGGGGSPAPEPAAMLSTIALAGVGMLRSRRARC